MRYGWSLDKTHWITLQERLKQRRWQRTYLESDYDKQVPRRPGVYMICGSPQHIPIDGEIMARLYNVLYVGKADRLRDRFKQHILGKEEIKRARLIFRRLEFWFCEEIEADLREFEQMLLDAFGPSANDRRSLKAKIGVPVSAGK